MAITPGQIYHRYDPAMGTGTRIQVVSKTPFGRVTVETLLEDGRAVRRRLINARDLHESPTIWDGSPRRTGYVLETDTD